MSAKINVHLNKRLQTNFCRTDSFRISVLSPYDISNLAKINENYAKVQYPSINAARGCVADGNPDINRIRVDRNHTG